MVAMMTSGIGKLTWQLTLCIALAGALHGIATAEEQQCPQSTEGPVVRWVHDADIAIRVAKALVEGRPDFKPYNDRPLTAVLVDETWVVRTVRRECPPTPPGADYIIVCHHGDGTAVVEITVYGKIKNISLNN